MLLAYAVYAGLFIYHTSFVVEGRRYFSLFDDAMVSMRYAKNLAQGFGAVWNPGGPRVEGYTNPLWVLFMAFFHCFPIDPSKISLAIQIGGALFLLLNLVFVKKIAERVAGGSAAVALAAIALTAFYLPLNNWGLQGMEVSALALLVSASVWKTLKNLDTGAPSWAPFILLGVGTLVRPDTVVPFLAIFTFLVGSDRTNRWTNFLRGAILLGFCILLQTGFRLWYYGDILPNTYYLKVTGYPAFDRMMRGLYVFAGFVLNLNPILFLTPFTLLILRRDPHIRLLFWVFISQAAYSIYVGGDAWEWWGGSNRYLCIVMPLFFVLLSHALMTLLAEGSRRYAPGRVIEQALAIVLLFTVMGFSHEMHTPLQLMRLLSMNALLIAALATGFSLKAGRREAGSGDGAQEPRGRAVPPEDGAERKGRLNFSLTVLALIGLLHSNAIHGWAALDEWLLRKSPMHVEDNQSMVERAQLLKRITGPEATIAVVWAGAIPYFAERNTVDLLGKSDRIIAHGPMRQSVRIEPNNTSATSQWLVFSSWHRFNQFYPGHLKWDYAYSIGELKPDVIVQLWRAREEAAPFLAAYDKVTLDRFNLYLRRGSTHINWPQVRAQWEKDRRHPKPAVKDD